MGRDEAVEKQVSNVGTKHRGIGPKTASKPDDDVQRAGDGLGQQLRRQVAAQQSVPLPTFDEREDRLMHAPSRRRCGRPVRVVGQWLPFGGNGEHGITLDDRGHLDNERPQRGKRVELAVVCIGDDPMRFDGGTIENGATQSIAVAVPAVDSHPNHTGLIRDALDGGVGVIGQDPSGGTQNVLIIAMRIATAPRRRGSAAAGLIH